MVVTRTPGAAASHRLAWALTTTTRLYLVIAVSCLSRPCGAFLVPSPAGSTKLQLTHDTASGRSRCRRPCSATREEATAAARQGRSNVGEETELRLMTWMEVEARVKRDTAETGKAAVIVPVGATEQHGPNGLIGTDHMTAEAVARGVCEVTGAILAPTINYGMSHHHESFPGTVTLRPATFVAVVRDVAASLSGAGFTHVLFVNGHGGNVGPAFKAFADFAAEQQQAREMEEEEAESSGGGGGGDGDSTARVKLISWYAGRESSTLAKELYGGEVGQHATPDEVAVTQHLFPESVKYGVELDPAAIQVAKDLGGMTKRIRDAETGLSVMDVQDFRRRFPDGRMFSNPALATPEHGRRLLEAAVRDATDALGKFLSGQDVVEEAEAKAKRAAAMAAAAAAAEAAAATEGKTKAGKTSFTPLMVVDAAVEAGDEDVAARVAAAAATAAAHSMQ
ncbi:unnamed protein product [Ectocarpus sp. CCAP 1310/34]|nr:unnamed protein product [Ectocarpus sp. CCAP 1310/34]